MKSILLSLFLAVVLATAYADNEKVVDKYDFDALLGNPEHWNSAFKCFKGEKECGELQELKEGVLRRLQTNCEQCTPQQREKYDHVMSVLSEKYPEDYKVIQKLVKKE